jgi:membrane protein CcdC involved in cytochrome C biogenesis
VDWKVIMKKSLKDGYLLGIIAMFLIFIVYTYLQHNTEVTWLPSMSHMPITNTFLNMGMFFSIITISALRFQVKGGIIAAIAAFPIILWCHSDVLAEFDIQVQLLFIAFSGIIVALLVGNYAASKNKLQKALDEIKTLSGMIPICASCKKIRDDKGYWRAVEHYIEEHTTAEFTHGICPDCAAKLYPDLSQQL